MRPLWNRRCAGLGLLVLLCIGCGGVPESAKLEAEMVSISINVTSRGRPVELANIVLHKPTGEGVLGELPSGGSIATRVLPGTYKVVATPSSESPAAMKLVTETYQDPAQTPWEIQVTPAGGTFELKIE